MKLESQVRAPKRRIRGIVAISAVAALLSLGPQITGASASTAPHFPAFGNLDCNGYSPIQKPLRPGGALCAEVHGGSERGHLEDNGWYIGHDEPLMQFYSEQPGSGNQVTWDEILPHDPTAAPTANSPLHAVTHLFENTVALWFSMDVCDPLSYPQLPCTPNSDANRPHGRYPGAGNAFLELQFYPPGFAPFQDSISCDNQHWCAALTIDSLECTDGFATCNSNCIEPINFAWIQIDGVPTGPPSPQQANLATVTPNAHTLLMNPGDALRVQIFDNKRAGALETAVTDGTTGQRGFMIASAANGFENTSIADCSGTPFSYQPEYASANESNQGSWAAANIDSAYEVGHFIPCSRLTQKETLQLGSVSDVAYNRCVGAYESSTGPDSGSGSGENAGDGPCFKKGDTHGQLTAAPDEVTGCIGEDLDYDGTSYRRDWPDSVTPDSYSNALDQFQPATDGRPYPRMQFITDSPATNPACSDATLTTECVIPPPQAPGAFYPYWTLAHTAAGCVWEFGQMTNGATFGGDKEWGKPTIYPGDFIQDAGPIRANPNC